MNRSHLVIAGIALCLTLPAGLAQTAAPPLVTANPNNPSTGPLYNLATGRVVIWDSVSQYFFETSQVAASFANVHTCYADEIAAGSVCQLKPGVCEWNDGAPLNKAWWTGPYSEADFRQGFCIPTHIFRLPNGTWAGQYRPAMRTANNQDGTYVPHTEAFWLDGDGIELPEELGRNPVPVGDAAACVIQQFTGQMRGSCVYAPSAGWVPVVETGPDGFSRADDVRGFMLHTWWTRNGLVVPNSDSYLYCNGCNPLRES